jgi:hypothetical protein
VTKVVIDTNYFLDLYRSNKVISLFFDDIKKIGSFLIVSDQLFDEFLRNRDTLLQNRIRKFKNSELNELNDPIKKLTDNLAKESQEMLESPEKDSVYINFKQIFEDSGVTKLNRTDEIIKKAHRRYLIGNPPKSPDKDSISDEILWELLINNLDDDLIILTKDGTYKNHNTFLVNEYKERTGKSFLVEEKFSNVLKILGLKVSKGIINYEESQIPIPIASFTTSRKIAPIPSVVEFIDTSSNNPTSWIWNFGDGSAEETTQNAKHVYRRPGLFTVSLIVANSGGSDKTTTRIQAHSSH